MPDEQLPRPGVLLGSAVLRTSSPRSGIDPVWKVSWRAEY